MVVTLRSSYRFFSPPRQNLYFVHVPKCGGSFVADTFGRTIRNCPTQTLPAAQGHKTYLEYQAIFAAYGLDFDSAPSFAVVRNPWAWHVSWFHYIKGKNGGRKSGHWLEHVLFQKFQFKDYIDWLEDPDAVRSPQAYITRQVSDWVVDRTGRIAVTHILRQENLEQELRQFVAQLDLRLTVASRQKNASRHGGYRSYYTDDLIDRIARRHERDLKLFGYTF